MMGDAFSTSTPPAFKVKLTGHGAIRQGRGVKDNEYVYSTKPIGRRWIHLARQQAGQGKTSLLLCARRAGRRRNRLGVPHVGHLHGDNINSSVLMDQAGNSNPAITAFAAFVGALLLLPTGWESSSSTAVRAIDHRPSNHVAGRVTKPSTTRFRRCWKRISADIALCIAVIAALAVGEYLAAAEAMFIVLVGRGLIYAAGRTPRPSNASVEQMPRTARRACATGAKKTSTPNSQPGDIILVRGGRAHPGRWRDASRASRRSTKASITGEPLPREKGARRRGLLRTLNGGALLDAGNAQRADTTLGPGGRTGPGGRSKRRAPWSAWPTAAAKFFLPSLLFLLAALTYSLRGDWVRTVSVLSWPARAR